MSDLSNFSPATFLHQTVHRHTPFMCARVLRFSVSSHRRSTSPCLLPAAFHYLFQPVPVACVYAHVFAPLLRPKNGHSVGSMVGRRFGWVRWRVDSLFWQGKLHHQNKINIRCWHWCVVFLLCRAFFAPSPPFQYPCFVLFALRLLIKSCQVKWMRVFAHSAGRDAAKYNESTCTNVVVQCCSKD